MSNIMIDRHRSNKVKGYPMPNDFSSFDEFLVAHRNWLRELRLENKDGMNKLFKIMKNNKGQPYLFAFLSGMIHIRKEYDRYLVRGIDATTRHLTRI